MRGLGLIRPLKQKSFALGICRYFNQFKWQEKGSSNKLDEKIIQKQCKQDIQEIYHRGIKWSFSRSSGPGGQNVNKLNTKVALHIDLKRKLNISQEIIDAIYSNNSQYFNKKGELILRSQRFRTQEANQRDCLKKLHELITEANNSLVKKEPSYKQTQRVKTMIEAYNERRIQKKRQHSEKKKARKTQFQPN
ncbi:hypothetical protein T552_01693 [Pneumocystis carinii B80]|uniref:Prokaryotic-type class I peptide chain release factors domain-containing protein n=1 Tax=Pneumocystis carinii (strain B80) TaxID=1408658 RepID=A0A0W4ZJ89_PNEC8|nr:hypothetical protein T552_01693 [Pneumocystis carinii B80]KTW28432.1 hypothetical protein T552_01693 [Pneumocystis carinii B80]